MKKFLSLTLAMIAVLSLSVIPAHASAAYPALIPITERYGKDAGLTIVSIEQYGEGDDRSLEFNFSKFAADNLKASEVTEDTDPDARTFSAFKVIVDVAGGERVEYSTFRYGEGNYFIDLTYNKVNGRTALAVGYKNVYLVSELELYHEIAENGAQSLVRDERIGMVVPEAMLRTAVQAAYSNNLNGALRAFQENGLAAEIFVFDHSLAPTAYDISEAKG